nr:hypothetical protein [Alkalispirochaeta americana]
MHDAIDDHTICTIDFEQYTIITNSQPVLRRVVRQLLHVSL